MAVGNSGLNRLGRAEMRILDRYRTDVRKMKLKKLKSQVLFFERQQGRNTVTALSIGEQGELPLKQPRGYRNFFIGGA